jgi:hypothetical protein
MQYLGFDAFEKSINHIGDSLVFMAKDAGETVIIIASQNSAGKSGEQLGFTGTAKGSRIFRAPLIHENAQVLRTLFPFTSPVRGLKDSCSIGLGDRLGIAAPGHIKAVERRDIFPVFAQQSIRELNLTCRTYEDVLDAATFAVFREGYKKGFGADGDHLKTAEDVEYALSLGFSMITLDCSDHIKNDISANALPVPGDYKKKYLDTQFNIGEGITLSFNEAELQQCIAIYKDAINFAGNIYRRFFSTGRYKADFEISIDETISATTPLQHFFCARELLDAGVSFVTIAPRFCGEFQKGIDYRGDTAQFDIEIKIHAAIARHLGYKLSIHSGSDKFSVFSSIGRETRGLFHVKTAGTNWLQAMRVVSLADAFLYRQIHQYALSVFSDAAKYYHVTADLSQIPDISALNSDDLPRLFEIDDLRQLIHITYGFILNCKDQDGSFTFKDRLYKLWQDHEDDYAAALARHIGRHIDLLMSSL